MTRLGPDREEEMREVLLEAVEALIASLEGTSILDTLKDQRMDLAEGQMQSGT